MVPQYNTHTHTHTHTLKEVQSRNSIHKKGKLKLIF
jgi:hypothetical protein